MSKVDDIKKQLAQRLEKGAAQETNNSRSSLAAPTAVLNVHQVESANTKTLLVEKRRPPQLKTEQPAASEGSMKLSISLYNFDLECLDRIREYMRKNGIRNISDSEALRLACRAVKIDEAFLSLYQDMQKEDRRRRKQ